MENKKRNIIGNTVIVTGSVIGIVFWLIMTAFSYLMGGTVGPPDFERTVPIIYVSVTALGIVGALLNLFGGLKYAKGQKDISAYALLLLGNLLCITACVVFFFMELSMLGFIALCVSVLPSAIFLLIIRLSHR